MSKLMMAAIFMLGAYFVGSLPVGLYVARWWKGIDVREHGSGNIGATNVFRVVGPVAGTMVLLVDVLKGYWAPAYMGSLGLDANMQALGGMAAILGHNFSPFLGFKGGKGVSTSLGVLLGIAWQTGLTALFLWLALVGITGIVSIGSIAAALSLVPSMLVYYQNRPDKATILAFGAIACLFVLYKHIPNMKRLLNGTENSFRKKSKASEESK